MSKMMTVDILSSIQGAKESETITRLFEVIKNANTLDTVSNQQRNYVTIDSLREDIIVKSSEIERNIIIENFPQEKYGYLVVAKVIEE